MTTSISSSANAMSQMRMHRPDPSQMASKLFSKLDTQNKGYVEKSDLQSAFDQVASSGNSGKSASVDDVFKQLDGDGDGKITKDEMTSGLSKLAEQLNSQFNNMRMNGFGGAQGMPPPHGGHHGDGDGDGNDAGFTKDQLTAQLSEIGSSDSRRADLISNIVSNFDKADADGDGKVTRKEAMAYQQANSGGDSSSTSASSGSSTSTANSSDVAVMKKIMQLLHTYGNAGQDASQAGLTTLLSVSA